MDENRRNAIMWEIMMGYFVDTGNGKLSVLSTKLIGERLRELVEQKKLVEGKEITLDEAQEFGPEFIRDLTKRSFQEMNKQDTRPQMGGVKRTPRQMQ